MRKLIGMLVMVFVSVSFFSCRESTQQKTQDAVEAIGEDIEDNTKEAGRKIEEGAKKVQEEVQEEIENTDDVNGEDTGEKIQ